VNRARAIQREPIWPRIKPFLTVFDPVLSTILLSLVVFALITQYSAAFDFEGRFIDHSRNLLIAFMVMWVTANLKPQFLMRIAVPLYVVGVILLVAVELFGDISKGAQRWLNLGFIRIQPSEIMKISMPLMLAWFFQQRENVSGWREFAVASVILAIPGILILKQPDLGTALLVLGSGFFVIFFAGLSWKVLAWLTGLFLASLPLFWTLMHDYQRQRVLTLLDPTQDPLGKGFHIIQSTVAVGSGGFTGKGFCKVPKHTLNLFPNARQTLFCSTRRGVWLAGLPGSVDALHLPDYSGPGDCRQCTHFVFTPDGRCHGLDFFTYAFVNIGMVSGILPVVGVPLPLMSYGGTAMVTLGMGAGILMSIQNTKKLIQT